MRYYLAADGGGTKLQVLLFDEKMHLIQEATTGGTNNLLKDIQLIEQDVKELLDFILPPYVKEIECFYSCCVGTIHVLYDALKNRIPVHRIVHIKEAELALSVVNREYGTVALSGTGSCATIKQEHFSASIGGWGHYVGDEGSGYDIGLKTIHQIIYCADGRRADTTILEPLFLEQFHLERIRQFTFLSATSKDRRMLISSIAKTTAKAASLSDPIALEIYRNAGIEIGKQVLALFNKNGHTCYNPIVITGGAWKGSRTMFESFKQVVLESYPMSEFIIPEYEPVIGALCYYQREQGFSQEQLQNVLWKEYEKFQFKIQE